MNFFYRFKYFDLPLQIATLLLILIGLALLYSISVTDNSLTSFWKQLIFLGFGLGAFLFFSFFDYHTLAKDNRLVYIVLIALLVYLLVLGPVIRGGRRWITFGFFQLQVGEFAKIVIILGLSRLLYLRRGQINSWKNIILSFCYALLPAGLIILEPDLGSALIILAIWAGIILISPIKKQFLVILFIAFIALGGVTWKYFLKDFQRDRVLVFLNPSLDPKGRGYNVRQAAIAIGSGQLFGRGLGKGLQTEHKFLPEKQTDFIFAASAEEIGFFGSLSLLGLYFYLLYRILKILRAARDDLGMYLAGGVFFLLFFHFVINIGMNIGLLPVTGIPLPLLSYGGSFLVAVLIALGIVQNVAMQSKVLRF